MARRSAPHTQRRRTLFVRVGWMRFYSGPVPGDERPVGGGSYNERDLGHEVYNFRESDGRLYGYFQPPMRSKTVALERIDVVARRPEGGQVVVGWYKDADLFRRQVAQSPGKPQGHGHFCSADQPNCVLLPDKKRRFPIPYGAGGIGRSNVCYPLNTDGSVKEAPWIQEAVDFIEDYEGGNILQNPEMAAEEESAGATEKALAQSKGQGFARTAGERRALEKYAMAAAKEYFRQKGFDVQDVSAKRPYDLLCMRDSVEVHVEVKGTTTNADSIVLTNNEAKHACDPRYTCVLFVLHSIVLNKGKPFGGKQLILNPWQLDQQRLTAVSYTYRLR